MAGPSFKEAVWLLPIFIPVLPRNIATGYFSPLKKKNLKIQMFLHKVNVSLEKYSNMWNLKIKGGGTNETSTKQK